MADGTDETGSLDTPPGEPGEPDATVTDGAPPSRWARLTRDRRVVLGAAALAVVLLLGGLALAFAGGGDDDDDDDARRASVDGPAITLEPKPGDRDGDGVPDDEDEDPDDARVGRRAVSSTTDPDDPDDPTGGTGGPGGTGGANTTTSFRGPPVPGGSVPPLPEDPEEDVVAAYLRTWQETCNAIWARSPNGILVDPYLPDSEFTVDECTLYADPEGAIGFFLIEDAVLAAQTEAWDIAADLGTYGVLCVRNTNNCWEWGE